MTRITDFVALVTDVLGEPITEPEDSVIPLRHRTWGWCCPRCLAGTTDIDYLITPCARQDGECDCGDKVCIALLRQVFPYRPFTVTSDGAVYCKACRGTEAELALALKLLIGGRSECIAQSGR